MRNVRGIRILVTALVASVAAGCHPLDNVMVDIFGRSMRDQRSFDPYENPRPEPPHSVSFASGNFPPANMEVNIGEPEGVDVPYFTQQDMLPVGTGDSIVQSLVNPSADSVELARGKVLFVRFCAPCHGEDGIGKDAYIAAKHPVVSAYNLAGARVQGYTDQYIYAMIRRGRGLMPEYGSRISHFDRWNIVNYLRTLQQAYNGLQANQQQGGD